MTDAPTKTLSLAEVTALAKSVLVSAGMDERGSDILADLVMRSERDGPRSHGLRMLPVYAQSFASNYANPTANPSVDRIAPGVLRGNGDNGYYQIAGADARDELISMTRENGIASFTCANCHHLGALRFDTEPLAQAGLVAMGVVNSLSMVVPQGGAAPCLWHQSDVLCLPACGRRACGLGSGLLGCCTDGCAHGRRRGA